MHDTDANQNRSVPDRGADDGRAQHVSVHSYSVDRDEPLDVAITYAIASVEDVDPQHVEPPLHDVIDPEALERLFESATGDARARFSVGRYDVTVEQGGREVVIEAE